MDQQLTPRTEAQQEASRLNGAKSQGPKTEEGKQTSSQNRTTHGLYSKKFVCVNEKDADYQAKLEQYRAIHQPRNQEEDDLVRTMASAQFRKDRMDAIVTALFDLPLSDLLHTFVRDHGHSDPVMFQAIGFKASADSSRAIDLAHRMMMQFDRLYQKSRATLERIRKPAKSEPPPPSTVENVAPAKTVEFPPPVAKNKGFEPGEYLHGMTREETLDLLRRDIYRPDTIDKLLDGPNEPRKQKEAA